MALFRKNYKHIRVCCRESCLGEKFFEKGNETQPRNSLHTSKILTDHKYSIIKNHQETKGAQPHQHWLTTKSRTKQNWITVVNNKDAIYFLYQVNDSWKKKRRMWSGLSNCSVQRLARIKGSFFFCTKTWSIPMYVANAKKNVIFLAFFCVADTDPLFLI